jgi:hypothetical protein
VTVNYILNFPWKQIFHIFDRQAGRERQRDPAPRSEVSRQSPASLQDRVNKWYWWLLKSQMPILGYPKECLAPSAKIFRTFFHFVNMRMNTDRVEHQRMIITWMNLLQHHDPAPATRPHRPKIPPPPNSTSGWAAKPSTHRPFGGISNPNYCHKEPEMSLESKVTLLCPFSQT